MQLSSGKPKPSYELGSQIRGNLRHFPDSSAPFNSARSPCTSKIVRAFSTIVRARRGRFRKSAGVSGVIADVSGRSRITPRRRGNIWTIAGNGSQVTHRWVTCEQWCTGLKGGPVRICQFMHSIFRFFDDI